MKQSARKKLPARKLPEGVVDIRKVKTVFGADGRDHLTFVLAYQAEIEAGSDRYEAIRKFADSLKAPASMDHSVMLLPVAPHESAPAEPPARPPPKQAKARARAPAKLRARPARKVRKPRTKTRTKPRRASGSRAAHRSRKRR